ncbi:MAG: tetratricopeptide repeat protein, partial [Duncaniella sp.]|nr:tetratricopeptide repeat protein [Duncaniella sp.]
MNFRNSLLTLLLILAATFSAGAQNRMDEPMTKALMNTYQQLLDEDPHDADVLFRRANVYYKCGDYLRALEDINNGFK